MGRLSDKVAIITGAAGGIGSAAARRFVDEGAKVLLVDRDEGALQQATTALPSDRVGFVVADVTDEAAMHKVAAEAKRRFGRVDIALLNAGMRAPSERSMRFRSRPSTRSWR
jgi:NAD(P)-dependent dehydrogenase (short-subunit alcohol dehydrogenase family)